MIIFSVLFLLLGCTTSNAKNVLSFTMYEVIAKSCTNLNLSDTFFINQNVFKKCKSWTDINETTELTKENEENVLCLLYYHSFMSFCSDLKSSKISNVTINLVPDLKGLDIHKICRNLTLFPVHKKFEHSIDKILNEDTCIKLCEHYNGSVVTECGLAHYFANYNLSKLIQKPMQKTKEKLPPANLTDTKTNSLHKPSEHSNLFSSTKDKNEAGQPQDISKKPENNQQDSETLSKSNSGKSSGVSGPGDESQITSTPSGIISTQKPADDNDDNGGDGNLDTEDGNGSVNSKPNNLRGDAGESSLSEIDGEKEKEESVPLTVAGASYNTAQDLDGESYFFSYFMVICVLFVLGYVGYHNRQKVMALVLEGKRGKRQVRGRRPNSANYHKLDSNLEEAISSTCTKNSSNVIY